MAYARKDVDAASRSKRTFALCTVSGLAIAATLLMALPASPEAAQAEELVENNGVSESAGLEITDQLLSDDEWTQLEAEAEAERIRAEEEAKAAEEQARLEEEIAAEAARKADAVQLTLTETSQGSLEENAKKVYSILRAAGIPDVNIAGVLGNWETESMIDPTCIEGIYGEQFFIGSQKSAAIANPSGHAQKVFSSYATSGICINQNAYRRSNGEYWPGIGLGGFTGPSIDPLINWASSIGKPWYSLETQVTYALKAYPRAAWLASWTEPCASPADAASAFLRNWEGCNVGHGKRAANAQSWYEKMSGWLPDLEYGNSVLALG